jgi:SAM-dependent methyltransferase
LPFDNPSFDRVISNVALPYMDIPKTLLEIHRVLVPGGQVWLSLHPASFTVREIRNTSSHLLSLVFRLYVLGNGVWFHCTGKTLWFVKPANGVLSDRARNEDCTPARGIHKCHFYSPRGTGRKEAECAGNKDRLDFKRARGLVADACLNPRFKFHCSTQPHISNCWLPAAI